jgi:hypothetical protein
MPTHMNPVHIFPPYFPKIFSSHLHVGVPRGLYSSRIPTKIFHAALIFAMRAACPADLIPLKWMQTETKNLEMQASMALRISFKQ